MTKKSIKATAAAAMLLAVVGGTTVAISVPSQAATTSVASTAKLGLPTPGPGDVINGAKAIYDAVKQCDSNQAAGLPCFQSTGQTVNEIYTMMKDFTAKYDVDQARTQQSFDVVIANQKNEQVRAEWQAVRADFETSHVGMQLLESYADCARVYTSDEDDTCMKVDSLGNVEPDGQRATTETLSRIQSDIAFNDSGLRNNVGGYTLSPADLAQRIGGKDAGNPYAGDGLLHAILDREQTSEAVRQKLTPGTALSYYPSAYVNRVGEEVTAITTEETGYFAARVAASTMNGDTSFAAALSKLANSGRPTSSPVLSIEAQREAHVFPGWTPETQLSENQSYFVGEKTGAVLLKNHGDTTSAPSAEAKDLPTAKELNDFGSDFGARYTKYQALNPTELPAIGDQLAGNAGKSGGTGVARLWSAASPTWDVSLRHKAEVSGDHLGATYSLNCLTSDDMLRESCPPIVSDQVASAPVTGLGSKIRMKGENGKTVEVAIPADATVTQSVPFTVYPAATNVQKGWGTGGSSGQTLLTLPDSMSGIAKELGGSKVVAMSPQPGSSFAEPTWDAYTHAQETGTRHLGRRTDSFGPGVLVKVHDASAGNLEFVRVATGGALR